MVWLVEIDSGRDRGSWLMLCQRCWNGNNVWLLRERERGVWLGVDGGELSTVGGVNSVTILNSSTWLPIFLGIVDKNF